ncbi:MAG: hypothetical protein ABI877_15285, partial [Gemmatimonadaceae bacterium]
AACDIPSTAPMWETEWGIAVKADSFSVADFLPNDITMLNGVFRATPPTATSSVFLSEVCGGVCVWNSLPKPAFTTELTTNISIAGDVVRATTGSGSALRARVTQNFGFDILAPSGATGTGSLVLRLLSRLTTTSPWDTISTTELRGSAATLPSGTTLSLPLPITAGRTIGRDIRLEVAVSSPAGGPVVLDGSASLNVTLDAPSGVAIAAATIRFSARAIENEGGKLDLTKLDFDADKLRGATLTLDIDNPLAVVGEATLLFQHKGVTVLSKEFPLAPAHSAPVITFTGAELQKLRGAEQVLVLRANVRASNANGEVTVRPADVIRVKGSFQATIRPTGSPSISQ